MCGSKNGDTNYIYTYTSKTANSLAIEVSSSCRTHWQHRHIYRCRTHLLCRYLTG